MVDGKDLFGVLVLGSQKGKILRIEFYDEQLADVCLVHLLRAFYVPQLSTNQIKSSSFSNPNNFVAWAACNLAN